MAVAWAPAAGWPAGRIEVGGTVVQRSWPAYAGKLNDGRRQLGARLSVEVNYRLLIEAMDRLAVAEENILRSEHLGGARRGASPSCRRPARSGPKSAGSDNRCAASPTGRHAQPRPRAGPHLRRDRHRGEPAGPCGLLWCTVAAGDCWPGIAIGMSCYPKSSPRCVLTAFWS